MTTQFNNDRPAQYADEIGNLDAAIKEQTERLDALKAAFKALNISAARGQNFAITVTETSSERLDTKKLTADLGKDTLAPYYTTTNSQRMTIKAVARLAEVA
jgi:hypothetical protein